MSDDEETPGRVAIGLSFGNSYSSFAYTNSVSATGAASALIGARC